MTSAWSKILVSILIAKGIFSARKILRFLKKYQLLVFCLPALMVLFRMLRYFLKKKTPRLDPEAISRTKKLLADMRNKPIHALNSSGLRAGSADEIKIKRQQMIVLENIHSQSAGEFEKLKREGDSQRDQLCSDSCLLAIGRKNQKRRGSIDSKIQKCRGEKLKKVLSQCSLAIIHEE